MRVEREEVKGNRPRGRKIFRNFLSLVAGKVLGDACAFLLFVVLSRAFGPEGIGRYSFAIALTSFFALFAEFGLYELSIKEMSRRTEQLRAAYYGGILSLRLILSGAVLGILLFIVPFLPFPYPMKLIILLVGAYQVICSLVDGLASIFVAREEMHLTGLLELLLRAITTLAGVAVVLAGGSLLSAMAALPAVGLGYLLVAYGIVTRRCGRPGRTASWTFLVGTLREAIPYALSSFLVILFMRGELVLLGLFLGAAEVGIYNVAHRVVLVLLFLPYFAGVALFPLASRLYVSSRKELERLYPQLLNVMVLTTLPAACGLWLVAPMLVGLIFGKPFAESAAILRLLSGLLFLTGLKTILATFLMSCDQQVERTKCEWIAAGINLFGNMILLPLLGIKGVAIARLISEACLVLLLGVRMRALLGWPRIGSRLAMGGVATAAFFFPFALFPAQPPGLMVPVSMLLYAGVLLLFKEVRENEVCMLIGLVKGSSGRTGESS